MEYISLNCPLTATSPCCGIMCLGCAELHQTAPAWSILPMSVPNFPKFLLGKPQGELWLSHVF